MRQRSPARQKVVIHEATGKHSQREDAAPPVVHILVQSEKHEREDNNGFMKMIEKDIIDGKAGKGVEKAPIRAVCSFDIPAEKGKGRQGSALN